MNTALNYVSKWVKRLMKETQNAPGYTRGEKQVVLMNLSKVETELRVAKLIQKDIDKKKGK